MNKKLKRLTSIVLCAAMLVVAAPVGAFAEGSTNQVKVISKYEEKDKFIKGTIDFQNGLTNNVTSNVDGLYSATFGGEVDVREIFEGAYQIYLKKYKNKPSFIEGLLGKRYENIVMFDEGEKFPTCTFKVQLPANANEVNLNDIKVQSNSGMFGPAEVISEGNNTYAIKFKLGGWYDYKGFFAVYEKERKEDFHKVSIQIPYTVDVDDTTNEIGTIKTDGYCRLYKYGKYMKGSRIVDVEAVQNVYNISK